MDGPALSGRERRLLEEIEDDLRQDSRLDRRLSTMGAKRPSRGRRAVRGLARRVPTGVAMTGLVMSAVCLSIAVRKPTAAVLIGVAVLWAGSVALAAGIAALLHHQHRHQQGGADDLGDSARRPDLRGPDLGGRDPGGRYPAGGPDFAKGAGGPDDRGGSRRRRERRDRRDRRPHGDRRQDREHRQHRERRPWDDPEA
ncbi:DUF3040 domain-containing protein [Streptomyces sp. BE20]|uniref:DUF3040 domain-containing protein n=1 Tax=Streptomyces sp. BE20 TaxID=3002525 RepID=UPI002E7A436C|nr:DUF3040 domain-containing protein [Streptomyces sp. BE20]MEE1825675.1 DUF3040 domain-containing protein [Streptomyces sp. BE20]